MTVPSAPARSSPRHPVRLPSHRLCPGMSHSSGQASGTTAMVTGDGMPGRPRGVTGGDRQAPWNVAGREGTWRGTNFSNSEEAARMRRTVEPGGWGWVGGGRGPGRGPTAMALPWRRHPSPAVRSEVGLSVAEP